MANKIENSPITLTPDRAACKSIPEIPMAVQDAFGSKATVVGQRGRWCGLVLQDGAHVFAWFASGKLVASAVTTKIMFTQTLESDADGRALVIGEPDRLYAVDRSGASRCLGVLADGERASSACWLPGGGIAVALGRSVCIYALHSGRLRPRVRFEATHDEIYGLRCFDDDPSQLTLAAIADDRGSLYAIPSDDQVRVLADWDDLDLADVRMFIDESGRVTWLPDGPTLGAAGDLTRLDGVAEAWATLAAFPLATLSVNPAPELLEGPDLPAPERSLTVTTAPVPDAVIPPSLDRFGPLTAAFIRLLRAGPKREQPDVTMLKLIREGMPVDLRAYVHAWACHVPSHPTVYEYWSAPPRLETAPHLTKLVGQALSIGTFASGEPILARLSGAGSCEVVMIDEEGQLYRYRGLEGFFADLERRKPDDWDWELA